MLALKQKMDEEISVRSQKRIRQGLGLSRHCHLWGLHTVFTNDGSKTPKRFFFISLDNFL